MPSASPLFLRLPLPRVIRSDLIARRSPFGHSDRLPGRSARVARRVASRRSEQYAQIGKQRLPRLRDAAEEPRRKPRTGRARHRRFQPKRSARRERLEKFEIHRGKMVGARGFEPPTPWTPSKCATRLRYAPTRLPSYAIPVPDATGISRGIRAIGGKPLQGRPS